MSRPVGGSQNGLLNGLLRPLLLLLLLLLSLRLLLLLLSLRLLLLLLLRSARWAARWNVTAADLWPLSLWCFRRGRGPLRIASLRRAARVLREHRYRSDHDRGESSADNEGAKMSCSHTPVPR
jgi:hypothetical protein